MHVFVQLPHGKDAEDPVILNCIDVLAFCNWTTLTKYSLDHVTLYCVIMTDLFLQFAAYNFIMFYQSITFLGIFLHVFAVTT